MTIAIYGRQTDTSITEYISPFLQTLVDLRVDYWMEARFYELFKDDIPSELQPKKTFNQVSELDQEIELLFTFGGDGTILKAANFLKGKSLPIVGVNTGRLGFLATINIKELQRKAPDLLAKKFNISQRSVLEVSIDGFPLEHNFALNEVTISRKESTSMINLNTHLKSGFLSSYWADGLIVATPTGSTGYSLSCGGPIISPETDNFLLTPIAPHNLNARPFVISDKEIITLNVEAREDEFLLSLDSRIHSVPVSSKITIKKGKHAVLIAQELDYTYGKTLREKLHWGKDSRS